MKFPEQYQRALELLPEELHERFKDTLVGILAHCAGEIRREQCLQAALWVAQKFEPEQERKLFRVK
jgi:hypothetical protein